MQMGVFLTGHPGAGKRKRGGGPSALRKGYN
jgi:hypothetical protein